MYEYLHKKYHHLDIIVDMADYNNNSSSITDYAVKDKFELLKRQYELTHNNDKIVNLSEEELQEKNVINTISSLNGMLNNKLAEIKQRNHNIQNLNKYKTEITDVLTICKDMEKKYVKLYKQNALNSIDVKLQQPLPQRPMTLQEKLSGDLRAPPVIEDIYEEMKYNTFIVNESYIHNMCDVIEKVNIKICDETIKLDELSKFVNTYKSILNNCADKTILNKYKCTICFENEVKICVTPCGHTFCDKCSKNLSNKCFVCNGAVIKKTTLFFLGKEEEDDEPSAPETVQPYRAQRYF